MIKRTLWRIFILTLILWIGGYSAFIFDVINTKPQEPNTKTNAIIVLTGGKDRITKGLELFQKANAPNLFITGVNQSVSKADIISMWKANETTLPNCCITLGHEATTTLENAIETKNWIESQDISSIRLVTSAYHMKRASLEFNYLIKNIKIIPHPLETHNPPIKDIKFWKLTFSEYNKFLFRWTIISLIQKG